MKNEFYMKTKFSEHKIIINEEKREQQLRNIKKVRRSMKTSNHYVRMLNGILGKERIASRDRLNQILHNS